MRVSYSVLVAALCSSAFAAPQVNTVVTTIYPKTTGTSVAPKPASPPIPTTVQTVPKPASPIPTLSLSPQVVAPPPPSPPAPKASSASPTPPKGSSAAPPPPQASSPAPFVPKASSAAPPLPKLSPRPPRPQAPPAGPSTLCGTGRPACTAGQYCYDANLDRVVGTTVANSVGTCYGAVCSASVSCPVGQVCGRGVCLNQNLDCGLFGDECPEEPGWRCINNIGSLGSGYCGYSPKFASF